MLFDSVGYAATGGMADFVAALITTIGTNVMSMGIGVIAYVFTGLGLYTIAKRRGIKHPWMAWVPVLNAWILGCISDQYRYVVRGEVRSRRKVLLVLNILKKLCASAAIGISAAGVVAMILNAGMLQTESNRAIVEFLGRRFLPAAGMAVVLGVISVVQVVFTAMAYYDLFASCEPENKVLYLVLGMLIRITLPIFLFVCRHKDLGMPARKAPQPEPEEIPVVETPEEPWENSEE